MENIWEGRTDADLLGRLQYHQDSIAYWKARPGHKDAPDMLKRQEGSYFDLLQLLMRRGVEIHFFKPDSSGPFR